MAKNHLSSPQKQQTPAMSTSYTYTVDANASSISPNDDDDNDICPVCDGECTCDNKPAGTVLSVASYVPSHPVHQSLKIRLTVPPGVLGRIRATTDSNSKKQKGPGDISRIDRELTQGSASQKLNLQSVPSVKRRGRPPKITRLGSDAKGNAPATFSGPSNPTSVNQTDSFPQQSGKLKSTAPPLISKSRSIIPDKRKRVLSAQSSDLKDVNNDPASPQFPTFVSASAMSSSSSNEDSSSSSSGFETDSSIEAEEENFIISEAKHTRDKARIHRELLGRDDPPKKRDHHNDWVIRPRKKSVDSGDDVEMEGESDVTEDEEEEDEEEANDDEEPDSMRPGHGYAGVATGWSGDDESSFDADLFFANLSDSTADHDSSQTGEGDDDDDNKSIEGGTETGVSSQDTPRREPNELLFDVTEGWDGQIVFTNGLREGQGILDIDFEVNAAQLVVDVTPSPSQDSSVDVQMTDGEDREYEDNEFDLEETDGETTEEELVDENGLPTERAMKLFQFPSSVSAINPMSTLSPTASPCPRTRRRTMSHLHSPKPADILAGKLYDLDDPAEHDGCVDKPRILMSKNGLPAMGQFEPLEECPLKSAIIDGSNKDVPSPYPRHRAPRGRSMSCSGRLTKDRSRLLSPLSSLAESNHSSFQIMSSEELLTSTSADLPPAEPIDLDDVLDASFLDSDASDSQVLSSPLTEVDSRRHLRNLSRWDIISVGAFRKTLETSGNSENLPSSWASETGTNHNAFSYENMIKSNTLGTMMFNHKTSHPPNPSRRRANAKPKGTVSPVWLPGRDGERTPTNTPPQHIPQPPPTHHRHHHSSHKSRKELKKEKKMKHKSYGPVNHHHQHHHHHHHPNMKTRSSSSMQRTNFFSSPASSVPALNL